MYCYHYVNLDLEWQNFVLFVAKCVFYVSSVEQNFPFNLFVMNKFYNIVSELHNENVRSTYSNTIISYTSHTCTLKSGQ